MLTTKICSQLVSDNFWYRDLESSIIRRQMGLHLLRYIGTHFIIFRGHLFLAVLLFPGYGDHDASTSVPGPRDSSGVRPCKILLLFRPLSAPDSNQPETRVRLRRGCDWLSFVVACAAPLYVTSDRPPVSLLELLCSAQIVRVEDVPTT